MPTRLIIGLMSGTSVDAIDAALVRIDRSAGTYRAKVLHHLETPWPAPLRRRLLAIMAPAETTTQEICELNALVATQFAAAVEGVLHAAAIPKSQIAALGSHGQTVCHLPPESASYSPRLAGGSASKRTRIPTPSTLQLGDVSMLATLTGITTVGNFRPADMAAGGQGAPLVPWTDDILLSHPTKSRCVQNIGGIANATYLPPLKQKVAETWTFYTPLSVSAKTFQKRPRVIAFDTGPGNMVMDAAISMVTKGRRRFDRGGRMARRGELDRELFRKLQRHPFFERRPPKSTGREDFGRAFTEKLLAENRKLKTENLLHTLTRLTAWSIADAYVQFLPELPDEVIVCGGGADNPVLMKMLAEEMAGLKSDYLRPTPPMLRRINEFGIPNKAKEAASFALLAAATLDGIPANLPSVTGASRSVILGVVARPQE
jgi:anhydro-N-acetylmuramic acid kinase